MDRSLAIATNRKALLRLLAMLFAAAGLVSGGSVAILQRRVRRDILRLLLPAESAVRRLVVMAAQGLSLSPRPAPAAPVPRRTGARKHPPAFRLFDPRKRAFGAERHPAGPGPRVIVLGGDQPDFVDARRPAPDDPVAAERLCLRLQALHRALETLPHQARRLARWRARCTRHRSPLRPGLPPGYRARPVHVIDAILRDCHALAHDAMRPPDTS